jgi:hypothetical protein
MTACTRRCERRGPENRLPDPGLGGAGRHAGSVTTILESPRYTGRQVWNRQRTATELADPANVTLGHKSVQRWNLPRLTGNRCSESRLPSAQRAHDDAGPAGLIGKRLGHLQCAAVAGLLPQASLRGPRRSPARRRRRYSSG